MGGPCVSTTGLPLPEVPTTVQAPICCSCHSKAATDMPSAVPYVCLSGCFATLLAESEVVCSMITRPISPLPNSRHLLP